jgi:uncharacterized membrane protein YebE (DUF533 family)
MLADLFLRSLVHGALGARRRPHYGAGRFLTGGGSFFDLRTLLGAAGLAWGAYEAFGRRGPSETTTTVAGGGFEPRSETIVVTPPPIPATPELPRARGLDAGDPDGLRRLVALTIAAARCDRELSEEEYGKILATARESGGEELVAQELANRRPVAAIVAGASDPRLKTDLYVLASGIVRADGRTSEVERAWLAELAGALGLDAAAVADLEARANSRIESSAVSGAPGAPGERA